MLAQGLQALRQQTSGSILDGSPADSAINNNQPAKKLRKPAEADIEAKLMNDLGD